MRRRTFLRTAVIAGTAGSAGCLGGGGNGDGEENLYPQGEPVVADGLRITALEHDTALEITTISWQALPGEPTDGTTKPPADAEGTLLQPERAGGAFALIRAEIESVGSGVQTFPSADDFAVFHKDTEGNLYKESTPWFRANGGLYPSLIGRIAISGAAQSGAYNGVTKTGYIIATIPRRYIPEELYLGVTTNGTDYFWRLGEPTSDDN